MVGQFGIEGPDYVNGGGVSADSESGFGIGGFPESEYFGVSEDCAVGETLASDEQVGAVCEFVVFGIYGVGGLEFAEFK